MDSRGRNRSRKPLRPVLRLLSVGGKATTARLAISVPHDSIGADLAVRPIVNNSTKLRQDASQNHKRLYIKGFTRRCKCATPLGDEFLRFITDPTV